MHKHVKYWILPDIENRIEHDEIHGTFRHSGGRNQDGLCANCRHRKAPITLKNDFVFAMTGYHPDFGFLEALGVRF